MCICVLLVLFSVYFAFSRDARTEIWKKIHRPFGSTLNFFTTALVEPTDMQVTADSHRVTMTHHYTGKKYQSQIKMPLKLKKGES